MTKQLTIILALALMGCTSSPMPTEQPASAEPVDVAQTLSLPAGFSVIEQQPYGYFYPRGFIFHRLARRGESRGRCHRLSI